MNILLLGFRDVAANHSVKLISEPLLCAPPLRAAMPARAEQEGVLKNCTRMKSNQEFAIAFDR